jgi:hypothetical protein
VYRRLGYEPVMEVLRYRLLHEPSES